MTLDQWLDRASGYTVTVPEGFDYSQYYGTANKLVLDHQAYVTIHLDHGALRELVGKALRNKSRRSRDGALTVRVDASARKGER
jgi:hypothetical protein